MERRGSPRYPAPLSITAQPVNQELDAAGEHIQATGINLSASGLLFTSSGPLLSDWAVISMDSADGQLNFLAKRIRLRRDGADYEIAVQFIRILA